MCFFKDVHMVCSKCKHDWYIGKMTYMTVPYAQRAFSPFFMCTKCGSQGKKTRSKNKI